MLKKSFAKAGDVGLIPGSGSSPGGEHNNPLQCSCLESPIEATVHRVTKSQTPQSDLTRAYLSKTLFSHLKNERMKLDN